jgi:cysteine synthase A
MPAITTGNILDLIGNTPMLHLAHATGCEIFAKAEFLNPGGSIKDRIAKHMLEQAALNGLLKPGDTVMEPTSGNTGIGVALCGVQMGYRVVIVMPENMSDERKRIIRCLGAELVLTPAEKSVDGALEEVARRRAENPAIFVPQQFMNPDNPAIHYQTTGPEIWEQMDGHVDVFVSGMGSGGTLAGVGAFLRERNPKVRLVAAEPMGNSALLGQQGIGLHAIQGIGDGFIPPVLDPSIVDEVIEVTDCDAIEASRMLAGKQGLLAGISAGANVWAAMQVAKKGACNLRIATILPDRAERYFSCDLI